MVHRISRSVSESGFMACRFQALAQSTRKPYRWLRSVAALLVLPAFAYASPGPTVQSLSVLFGSQSYNLFGSPSINLPWEITGIQAVFSEPITSGNMQLLSGSSISPSVFSGLGTSKLTWHFSAPFPNGNYGVELDGTGPNALMDAANNALNGGVNETHFFSVLIGDFNGDGQVNSADVNGVTAAESQAYNIFADVNGDGIVDSADVAVVSALVPAATSVPEPMTIALIGLGILGLWASRRKVGTRS
jgi:hypothetical protein